MQVVDDLMLRRFLRARNLDVEQASAMFLKYLKWRQAFAPNGSISASEVPNQIAQNKMFLQGSDKKGCPIAIVFGARHFQVKGGLEEFKRMFLHLAKYSHMIHKHPMAQKKCESIFWLWLIVLSNQYL